MNTRPDYLNEAMEFISILRSWSVVRFVFYAFGLLWLVVLCSSTWTRSLVWQSETQLWEEAALRSPRMPRPHLNLGLIYERELRLDDALSQFEHARYLTLQVGRDRKHQLMSRASAESNIALVRLMQEDYPEALHMATLAINSYPELINAYINRALAELTMGMCDAAEQDFKKSGLERYPRCGETGAN